MARILIIDDDELLGRMLVRGLSAAGHTVAVALNGFDGAKMFRQDPADLILTDINMPHGGLPTIRVLHAEFPQLKIIAMSGNSSQLGLAGAIGASRSIEKPFTIEELKAVIDTSLGAPVEPPPAKP